ncbi:Crp/Fnr family transcriptional regulator [Ferrimonas pelagia]|uniref:HTH crp-type domain-containing protein n=1 Tax=Ferrimonas pelagia TaxID=1177826 RepID=A0ABP9F7J2_9GAMM
MTLSNLLATKYKISRELAQKFSEVGEAQVYEKDAIVSHEGKQIDKVILPLSGLFGIHQLNPLRTLRYSFGLYTTGTVIHDAAFVLGKPAEFTVVTLSDASAINLPLASVRQLYQQEPECAALFARSASLRAMVATDIVSARLEPDHDNRVLQALRALNRLTDENMLALSNEQLGMVLGMSRNTVGRSVKVLVERGFIQHDRGMFTLIKP